MRQPRGDCQRDSFRKPCSACAGDGGDHALLSACATLGACFSMVLLPHSPFLCFSTCARMWRPTSCGSRGGRTLFTCSSSELALPLPRLAAAGLGTLTISEHFQRILLVSCSRFFISDDFRIYTYNENGSLRSDSPRIEVTVTCLRYLLLPCSRVAPLFRIWGTSLVTAGEQRFPSSSTFAS